MRIAKFFAFLAALMLGAAAYAQSTGPVDAAVPDPDLSNVLYLDLSTGGRVTIRMYPTVAPNHVERIKTLARQGFYDGVIFHRVIEGFMAQTGDPTGTGTGGSDLPDLVQEFSKLPHLRGTLAMARAQSEDSANSQFFIVFQPNFKLDGKYTVVGRVTSGMEFVDAIARGEPPANPDVVLQASLGDAPKPEPDYAAARARLNAANPAAQPAVTTDELNAPIRQ
ncbi:peptidylprolyl isomerase [Novosphingopyxis baekryungensis]|uniref:peptidylprolyl isomerase n=1 Tax=Novosphingopyxis baekryungensis TaxID=279369 RepID=UPI0003B4E2C2|nr:peptidylprolyl isomerase [Novosphingopyxis baekryungensis]